MIPAATPPPAAAPNAAAPAAAARWKSAAMWIFKIALAAILLLWLARSGRLDFSRLTSVRFGAAFFGMLFFQSLMLFCIALRWHFLTRACGLHFSLSQTLRISGIGHFAGVWTPAGLGLDGARLVLARRIAPQQLGAVAASAFWDRALGVWSLLALNVPACAVLLWLGFLARSSSDSVNGGIYMGIPHAGSFYSGVLQSENLQRALGILCIACAIVCIAPFVLRGRIAKFLAARNISFMPDAMRRGDWIKAFVLAFATHACNFLSLWCALRVLGIAAPVERTLFVSPPIVLSSLLPLTPLGLGVTDATAITLLASVAIVGGGEATMLGRASFILLCAACGLAWLWPKKDEA